MRGWGRLGGGVDKELGVRGVFTSGLAMVFFFGGFVKCCTRFVTNIFSRILLCLFTYIKCLCVRPICFRRLLFSFRIKV